jgi:hypothetical protein
MKVFQEPENSGKDRIAVGTLDFLGKKPYVHFQYFFRGIRGGGVPSGGKNFTDDGGIRLAVQPDPIQSVDNANNLTEGAIERAGTGTTGCNQSSVDVEKQQLHAAILSEGEFYFRLQKDFRRVKVYGELQAAGLFLADKT